MQGAVTIPPRDRLTPLLAAVVVLMIVAFMALVVWSGSSGFSGVETKGTVQAAGNGAAIVHDGAKSTHGGLAPGFATVHDDAGKVNR